MTNWHREYQTYSHEILWRACMTALDLAEAEHEKIRPDHLSIQSLLCGFLAFEGFINFVGEEIAPAQWEDERNFFSGRLQNGQRFPGIIGKVRYLYSLFPDTKLIEENDPYKTFFRIKTTRDNLAHNRVLKYAEKNDADRPSFKTRWDEFDSPEKVRPAVMELKALAEMIRVEAVKLLNDYYRTGHLYHRAFEGPLGHAEGKEVDP